MPSASSLAGAVLLAGVAAANPFTTLDVCPGADPTVPACTVTAQHQPISTCSPVSTTCSTQPTPTWGGWETSSPKNASTTATTSFKSCSTAYSYSTWAWVSTVIPCAWDGKSISSCTVTSTQQVVPCEISVTTSTSSTPTHTDYITYTITPTSTPTGTPTGTGSYTWTTSTSVSTVVDYSTSYQTISKMWNAPYNMLGPNAIPGYSGNDLYHDDSTVDGKSAQFYDVIECEAWNGQAPTCSSYTESHYDTISGYHSSTPVTATNSMHTSVPSAGAYTFTFTNSAPSAVITSNGQAYTQPAQPWFNYETRSADGPGNFDFTVTVTKTISIYWPGSTSAGSPSPVAPSAASHAWANWNAPSQPTSGSDPSGSSGWGSWSNAGSHSNGAPWGSHGAPPSNAAPGAGNGGSPSGAPWGGNGGFPGFPGAPGSGTFYIPVNSGSGSKYSTAGNQWIGFPNGGDDGAVVSSQGDAAQFYWDSNGNLMCNGQYVYTSTSAGYLVFELGPNMPSGPKFSVGSDGSFGLPGAGFCATDDTLFITFGGSPNGCKPVSCPIGGNSAASSSGWGQWAAATSSSSWTTQTITTPTGTWTGYMTTSTPTGTMTGPTIGGVTTTGGPFPFTNTGMTTTPTTTPVITGPNGPVSSPFALQIIFIGSKMARRADSYVALSGDAAVSTNDVSNAALFTSSSGLIALSGTTDFLGSSSATGSIQLNVFTDDVGNSLSASFDISTGYLTYPGAGFCVTGSSVQIFFGSAPSGCLSANLAIDFNPTSTTTTTTADVSGALDATMATATPANRRRGGVLRA